MIFCTFLNTNFGSNHSKIEDIRVLNLIIFPWNFELGLETHGPYFLILVSDRILLISYDDPKSPNFLASLNTARFLP